MHELNLGRVRPDTTKLHFIRAIGIIRWRSARAPAPELQPLYGPRCGAMGADDLDHERDITLAIHAGNPDLFRDTTSRKRLPHGLSETVQVELTGEAGSGSGKDTERY
jgi:hypothetical protein